ncbi:phage repressor protein CI [Vibrio cortegadensis]|uniref:phage repressor protein CI n=1 Tax=Vibrio cortegadensis TaxID=1328770 RepID=UPI0021C42182|nr:phage repressor protein CI [Vibrio cortegadensis]MDN3697032.1 phage repressor protein CI [Vibrio cortegadensis]
MKRDQVLPFEYLKGSEFTDNLKHITKCKTFLELAELLNVPKQTFSTWNLHNRTSHELMVRLHLKFGVPIEELALSEEERAKLPNRSKIPALPQTQTQDVADGSNLQHGIVILKSYCLSNGKLLPTGDMPYAKRIFNGWDLNELATIEVETNQARYLVDQSQNDAVSGEYLIDIDGRLSINQIQRLPNKLAIAFGDSTMEVSEDDIKVVGRVAVVLEKV